MVGRTKRVTKAERERFEAIRSFGCIACRKRGLAMFCGPTECHHLLSGGRRRGHEFSIPLGSWHHRAVTWITLTAKQMTEQFGPSLARGSKLFHAEFGDDETLLAETNKLLMSASHIP